VFAHLVYDGAPRRRVAGFLLRLSFFPILVVPLLSAFSPPSRNEKRQWLRDIASRMMQRRLPFIVYVAMLSYYPQIPLRKRTSLWTVEMFHR